LAERDDQDPPLVLQQNQIAHELLGDWFLKPAFQTAWEPLPLEWFPDPRLRSIAHAANEGCRPDDLPLALTRNGSRAVWPNAADAVDLLLQVPTRAKPLPDLVAELRAIHERRRVRDELGKLQHRVQQQPIDKTLAQLEELHDSARAAVTPEALIEPLPVLSMTDRFSELGPEPWVCEGLAFQPGNPLMFSGNSGTGKSWITTDLALAVASGQKFGPFSVRRGKVRWLHLEGSARDLRGRTQKLARARQLGPEDLDGWLYPSSHPRFNFQDRALERQLLRECDGFTMAVIDTFAVAAAGLNENDSAIRQPLDMLARVSDATGCAFLVIHHHRKDPQDARVQVDPEQQLRGSSAINNAISVGWSTRKLPRGRELYFHTRLVMGKTWYGKRADLICGAFASSFIPGAVDLYVREATERDDAPPEENHQHLDQEIYDAVAKRPGISLSGLAELLGKRRPLIVARVRHLETERRLEVTAGGRGSWTLRTNGPIDGEP
jgi:AAA domain